MGNVAKPHFGAHLEEPDFQPLKRRLESSSIKYIDNPYRRFVGENTNRKIYLLAIQ